MIKNIILFLFLLIFISCEKEGIYFDKYDIIDSTIYVNNYSVYSNGELIYQEDMNYIIKDNDLNNLKDSLQEIHRDKFYILFP